GVGIYGRIEDVSTEDMRRVFDTVFWGVVHGCRAAIPALRKQGGAIITVGSIESDRALPLSGAYAAAKHAVKGFIDTLRMELEKDRVPIAVSLLKPAGVDTPFFDHAKTYLKVAPKPAPPVYTPEVVANAILACAERPMRDVTVGGGGKVQILVSSAAPRAT